MSAPSTGEAEATIRSGLAAVAELRAAASVGPTQAESTLALLSWQARCVALAVMGPGRPDGLGATPHDEEQELAYASEIERDALLDRAISGNLSMEDDVPVLWERIILPLAAADDTTGQAMMADTLTASLCLTASGCLPGAVGDVADIQRIPTPRAQSIFALGIGHLARARHPTAEYLLLGLLSSRNTSPRLRMSLLRGAGAGLLNDGFQWLARTAASTPIEHERWVDAAREASYWALTSGWPGALDLVNCVWSTIDSIEDGLDHLTRWKHLVEEGDGDPDQPWQGLIHQWERWPAPARAALLLHRPDEVLEEPARWVEDMSPEVILAGMECAGEMGLSTVETTARWLNHPAARVREAAAEEIQRTRGSEPVPVPDEPADLVTFPTEALAHTPVDRIRVALVSDDPEQIVDLARSITPEDAPTVCRDLLAAMDVPDMSIRRAALEALALIGGEDEIEALLRIARRLAGLGGSILTTIRALVNGPPSAGVTEALVELMNRRLRWGDDEAVDHFLDIVGEAGIPPLIAALGTPFYPPARAGAARALARHGVDEAVFPLRLRSLMDRSVDVRDACLSAIASMGTTEVTGREMAGYAPLTAAADEMEQASIRARSGGTSALPGLRATMEHGTWQPRVAACGALGGIPGQAAEDLLLDALLDTDEDVRLAAQGALAARGWLPSDPRSSTLSAMAQRRLERLLSHPEHVDVATLALGLDMGGHLFRREVMEALDTLPESLDDWATDGHMRAAWYVARVEPEEALKEQEGLEVLLHGIDRTWQFHPYRSALIYGLMGVPIEDLVATVEQGTWGWRTRSGLCMAMRRPGANEAVPVLSSMLLDHDQDVRLAAVDALVVIGTEEAAHGLCRAAESPFHDDTEVLGEALAAMGDTALSAIDVLSTSEWWEARRLAAYALSLWRGDLRQAVDRLLPIGLDPEYRVAEAAHRGLRSIGLLPTTEGEIAALRAGQNLTVVFVLPWLRVLDAQHPHGDEVTEAMESHLRGLPHEHLAHRLGVAVPLRARQLETWLEELGGLGRELHLGVRLAAAEAIRGLRDDACQLCGGSGALTALLDEPLQCPRCGGSGAEEDADG